MATARPGDAVTAGRRGDGATGRRGDVAAHRRGGSHRCCRHASPSERARSRYDRPYSSDGSISVPSCHSFQLVMLTQSAPAAPAKGLEPRQPFVYAPNLIGPTDPTIHRPIVDLLSAAYARGFRIDGVAMAGA